MDTHMPTMDTTTARDLLMLSQRPRLMLMLSMDTMDMLPTHTPMVMPTTDITDTHMPTMDTTTARDLLMLKPSQRPRLMLMLSMDTMDMPPIRLWTLRICAPWILRIRQAIRLCLLG